MFKNMRSFWNAISFDRWPCGLHLVPQGLFLGGVVKEKEKENVIADDLQECAISQRNMHTTGMLFIFEMAWSCWTGSNRRPVAYEATALPTELHQQRGVQSVGVAPTSRQVRNRALHMLPLDIHPLLGETGGNWGKRNEKKIG